MKCRDGMPGSVRKLWWRLTVAWSVAWTLGLLLFVLVMISLSSRYYEQRLDAELRLRSTLLFGLAYLDDDGSFKNELLVYQEDLLDENTRIWFIEAGNPPFFHMAPPMDVLPKEQILSMAEEVMKTDREIWFSGKDLLGSRCRLLAIPTYQGMSEIPKAAILVSLNPNVMSAERRVVWGMIAAASILSVVGVLVGAVLARRSLQPLSEYMERREQFISSAAHELRTPLASLQAVAESAQAGNEAAEVALDRMMPLISRASSTVEDLLLYARLDGDQLRPRMEATRLDLLVEKCLPESGEISFQGDSVTVECDGALVEAAVRNLLANALRQAPGPEGVTVRVVDNRVVVENRGGGFPEAVIDALEKGWAVVPSSQGNGLGLPLVDLIMRFHGGHFVACNIDLSTAQATMVFTDRG